MNREALLSWLIANPECWGQSRRVHDWIFRNGLYFNSLHEPITIDDWNKAKISPNTKIRILSPEHSKYIMKLADELELSYIFKNRKHFLNEADYFLIDEGLFLGWGDSSEEFDASCEKEIFIELPVLKDAKEALKEANEMLKVSGADINARVIAEKTGSKHSHYFKDVSDLDEVDVYRVCDLFEVNDASGAKQHAIKKLLCSGKRGAKDERKDLEEARDTIIRKLAMMTEDNE